MPNLPVKPSSDLPNAGILSQSARRYARASMADNTRRAYQAQFKLWSRFAESQDIRPLPADPVKVANWLAERADQGQAQSTLRTAIAAVRAANLSAGHAFDSKHPAIELVMRGIGRANARAPRQSEPLRGTDVLELLAQLTPAPLDVRDGALIALGYVFAARRSELAGLDLEALGDGDGFVSVTAREIVMTLVRSKSMGSEPQVVAVPRTTNGLAVAAIEAWIDTAGIRPGEPLLRGVTKGGSISQRRLHPQSISTILKRRVAESHERLGVPLDKARSDGGMYSGHSLRVGVAVTAAEAGADARQIAQLGRWSSLQMPARYAKRAEDARTSPHLLPGVGLK